MNLPTREECQEIVKNSEVFYCSTPEEGIEIYNYRLSTYYDFKEHNAFELRGLTFIEYTDGNWGRFLGLHKFFNINENESTQYSDLKDLRIKSVQEKSDGSMITFTPHEDTYECSLFHAKSKMSHDSEQAKMAQDIYLKDEKYHSLIQTLHDCYLTPIFELISPFNQIVVEYKETDLILLQIRDWNGEYLSQDQVIYYANMFSIKHAEFYNCNITLEELMKISETEENIEGWVVTFENNQMVKIKTQWYNDRHHIVSEIRENRIIELILNEEIDDVLSLLSEESEKKKQIRDIQELIDKEFNHLVQEYINLRGEYFNVFKEDRKAFAIKYSKTHPLFGNLMKTLNTSFRDIHKTSEDTIRKYILQKCSTLQHAKEFLNNLN